MLTATQITAGTARLVAGKLAAVDVDQLVSVFRMFFADLEGQYEYDFQGKLEELDDTGNSDKKAAQVAACIIKLEELGFGVASLVGNLNYKEKDEYQQYVIIAFTKLYPLPKEFAIVDNRRRVRTTRTSQTAITVRGESGWGAYDSEQESRTR